MLLSLFGCILEGGCFDSHRSQSDDDTMNSQDLIWLFLQASGVSTLSLGSFEQAFMFDRTARGPFPLPVDRGERSTRFLLISRMHPIPGFSQTSPIDHRDRL